MLFRPSNAMKIVLLPEQEKQLSSRERIREACAKEHVLAFDIYAEEQLVGFAMLRRYAEGAYFLWNYAIDARWQNRHYGTTALVELIAYMKNACHMTEMTTTYIYGNEHAKRLYEKVGFRETDVVDEDGCHEVNMICYC